MVGLGLDCCRSDNPVFRGGSIAGGTHHINEQWPQYWEELFRRHNYRMLDPIRDRIRQNSDVKWWYRQNIFLIARVNVILSTYNCPDSLKDTLKSLGEMSLPKDFSWELIVVDNNSNDDTREVVKDFARTYGLNVRYIFEGNQGLSHARNAGITEAKSNIVAFADDDVIADSNWIVEIVSTFFNTKADSVGGKVLPLWLDRRPAWLTDQRLWGALALLDYGDKLFELKSDDFSRLLFGCNFALGKIFLEGTDCLKQSSAEKEILYRVVKTKRSLVASSIQG